MAKIKVLIADDIMILRQGLKAVFELESSIEVVALAENGKEGGCCFRFTLDREVTEDES